MPRKLTAVLGIALILIVIVLFKFSRNFALPFFSPSLSGPSVQINSTKYTVEIADQADEYAKGLGGRASMLANQGMLFVFNTKGLYQFWMKDMQFALDFVWIDGDKIVDLSENVPAPQSGTLNPAIRVPIAPVDKVLELNAGEIKKHKIAIGQKVIYTNK
jgi:uncharacterized membrane protein (UPF0127 family)